MTNYQTLQALFQFILLMLMLTAKDESKSLRLSLFIFFLIAGAFDMIVPAIQTLYIGICELLSWL